MLYYYTSAIASDLRNRELRGKGRSTNAVRACAVDLEHDSPVLEPISSGGLCQLLSQFTVTDLHRLPTVRADEQLATMVVKRVPAGKVGVEGLNLVDKALLYPEVQCAVHDRRHSLSSRLSDGVQNIIGFDSRAAGGQDLQDSPTAGRKTQAILPTMRGRIPENLLMCATLR